VLYLRFHFIDFLEYKNYLKIEKAMFFARTLSRIHVELQIFENLTRTMMEIFTEQNETLRGVSICPKALLL